MKAGVKNMSPEREQPPQPGAAGTTRFNNSNIPSAMRKKFTWDQQKNQTLADFPILDCFFPFLPVMQQLSAVFNQTYTTRFWQVLLSLLQLLEHMLCTRAGSHTLWHTQRAPELPGTPRAPIHLHSSLTHSLPWDAALPCSRESSWSRGGSHADHQR